MPIIAVPDWRMRILTLSCLIFTWMNNGPSSLAFFCLQALNGSRRLNLFPALHELSLLPCNKRTPRQGWLQLILVSCFWLAENGAQLPNCRSHNRLQSGLPAVPGEESQRDGEEDGCSEDNPQTGNLTTKRKLVKQTRYRGSHRLPTSKLQVHLYAVDTDTDSHVLTLLVLSGVVH